LTGTVTSIAQSSMFPFGGGGTVAPPSPSVLTFLVIYGASFVMVAGTTVSYVATYSATRRLLDGEPLGIAASYREALSPRNLVTVFLASLITLVGMCCCLAPGVIALIYFVFTIPILCEGTLWGWPAIERSYRLVRYNPAREFVKSTSLKVFLLFLIMGAISYAITFLVSLPTIVLAMMTTFRAASKGFTGFPAWWPVLGAVQGVVTTIATSFVAIYGAAVFTMLYRDTRERMEGSSLEQALMQRLAAGAGTPSSAPPDASAHSAPPDSSPGSEGTNTDAGPEQRGNGRLPDPEDTHGDGM